MNSQSFSKLTPEQQEKVIDNVVNAVQILHASVKARKEKEFIEKIQNGKEYGRLKRI
ncbi:MAG: hypothetical protein M1607_02195 [Patescibacteria group bacterium]|nr:hypothetical protein [Patescibacteria group bacterium]